MELRTHAHILTNARWFITVVTIAIGAAALLFALYQPQLYKAVVSFDVNPTNRVETADYQYGSYYELKAAEIYTQHLMSWFRTPAIVEEIYTNAGIGYEIKNINQFTNRFQAKQYSAQHFIVTFTDTNKENAQKLSDSIALVVETRSTQASTENQFAAFEVNALSPVIALNEYNPWLVTIVGLIAGLLASVIMVYVREYFRA